MIQALHHWFPAFKVGAVVLGLFWLLMVFYAVFLSIGKKKTKSSGTYLS